MSSNSTSTETTLSTTSSISQAPSATPTTSSFQTSSSSLAPASASSSSSSFANTSPTSASSISSSSQSSTPPTSIPSSSSSSEQPTTQPSTSQTSNAPPTTSNTPSTSNTQQQTSQTQPPSSTPTVVTSIITNSQGGQTSTIITTSTAPVPTIAPTRSSNTATSTSSSASGTSTAGLVNSGSSSPSSGLSSGGVIAVAVVVPIVAVTLLVIAALFFWRKRKARKDAEELRRKEVEEYGYNPNNDPTLPTVGGSAGNDGPFEMREEGSSGYRGWGTTTAVGSARKGSTTVSGGQSAGGIGMAYSEGTSPTQGATSDTRSDNPLMGEGHPGEAEALGAMGPASSSNRNGDINRGPSNASSSYSAAGRSDGSGEMGGFGGGQYNQYDAGNPYNGETPYGSPPGRAEMSGQPVIRDVQARRNTRIENPAHFPQQSAGIAQNF